VLSVLQGAWAAKRVGLTMGSKAASSCTKVVSGCVALLLPLLAAFMAYDMAYVDPLRDAPHAFKAEHCSVPMEQVEVQLPHAPYKSVRYNPVAPPPGVRATDKCSRTLVTGYFDLRFDQPGFHQRNIQGFYAKRTAARYLKWMTHVLQMRVPMVVHVSPEHVQFVKNYRCDQLWRTEIIASDKENFPKHEYFQELQRVIDDPTFTPNRPLRPEVSTPWYNVVQFSKLDFIRDVTNRRPFGGKQVYWIDAGYGHGAKGLVYRMAKDFPFCDKLDEIRAPNKVYVVDVAYRKEGSDPEECKFEDEQYLGHHRHMGGGFFGGEMELMSRIADLYYDNLMRTLRKNCMNDDQAVMWSVWCRYPELFDLHHGTWWTALDELASLGYDAEQVAA